MMFRSFSSISKYSIRDYATKVMVIMLVTMATPISSHVKDIYVIAGREVRIGKNCARGLGYGLWPAGGRAQDRGHSFSQYGPT